MAVASLNPLKRMDGQWDHRYPFWKSAQPTTKPAEGIFTAPPSDDPCPPGLDALVAAVEKINANGLTAFRRTLSGGTGVRREIALLLCGLSDVAFTETPPSDFGGLEAFLANHPVPATITSVPEGDWAARLPQLDVLVLRIVAEQHSDESPSEGR